MKKINFKQLKYMIPLGAFPFLLMLGYNIIQMFDNAPVEEDGTVETVEVNTDLPESSVEKEQIKSKFQSMLADYGKVTDRTSVDNIEKEEKEEKGAELGSVYSEQEKRSIDSINAVKQKQIDDLRAQLADMRGGQDEGEARVNISDGRIEDSPEMQRFTQQMQMIQRIANGERIQTEEEKERQRVEDEKREYRKQILDSIAKAEAPKDVVKAADRNERFFNSVKDKTERPGLICARIDEMVKVRDGSRIRIRLSEDVEIDGDVLEKGNYLYATVAGFQGQRVKARVNSLLVNGHIKKVELNVYDLDCIEGFYVPQSAFRELAKDAASNAMSMNVNMNESGEQDLQSIAMQSLQQVFQTTTSAITKQIRKNKAKIKYNTEIYLVNKDDLK